MTETTNAQRRPTCFRCQRPCRVCVCFILPPEPIETRTFITIIQTPAESKAKIKTADLVPLCLSNSKIVSSAKESEACISPHAFLLFPGDGSIPLDQIPRRPDTLVVLDATWDRARRILARSAFLQSLQRVSVPERYLGPPIFKARKPPTHSIKGARSTAEAVAAALECTEGERASAAVSAIRRAVHEASEAQLGFIRKKGPGAGRHRVSRSGYEAGMYAETPTPTPNRKDIKSEENITRRSSKPKSLSRACEEEDPRVSSS